MDKADKLLKISGLMEKYARSLEAGKPIEVQWKVLNSYIWQDTDVPTFSTQFEWREKPREPRHIYVTYSPEGFILGIGQKDKYIEKGLEVVEFVEKIQ